MSNRFLKRKLLLAVVLFVFVLSPLPGMDAAAANYIQVPGVVHIHTTFSSGQKSMAQIVEMARQAGVEALVFTDHDRVVMEYGVFPLRKIIKKRVEHPSVLQRGASEYLAAIEELNRAQNDVIVIPGVQSSPFYYWTGDPLKEGLTAHDYRKEILVIGMTDPEDYENLPILHNGLALDFSPFESPLFLAALFFLRHRPLEGFSGKAQENFGRTGCSRTPGHAGKPSLFRFPLRSVPRGHGHGTLRGIYPVRARPGCILSNPIFARIKAGG